MIRTVRQQLGVDVAITGLRGAFAEVAHDTTRGMSVHTIKIVYEARVRGHADPVPDDAGPAPPDLRGAYAVPAGQGCGRPDSRPPRVQRPGAYAVVVRGRQILLSRYVGDGRWSLPGGGIDHGEQPVEALRREVREETGLRLTGARLLDVHSAHFTGDSPRGEVEDFHAVRIIYAGTVAVGGLPQVLEVGGTSDAAAWFPIAGLGRVKITTLVRWALRLPERSA